MHRIIFFSLSLFLSPFSFSDENVRVLVMECEINVPASYSIDARIDKDYPNLRFFQSGLGTGSIYIGAPDTEDVSEELVEVAVKKHGHLIVQDYKYKSLPELTISHITSFDQQIKLYGDAASLKNDIINQCLETTDSEKVNVGIRKSKGCMSDLNLRKDYSSLYEGTKFGIMRSNSGGKTTTVGLVIRSIDQEHQLAKLGIQSDDIISSVCGIPFGEALKSGDNICCPEPVSEELRLSIKRKGKNDFDIKFRKNP